MNGRTTCNQSVTDSSCIYLNKSYSIYIAYYCAQTYMTNSEITSNRCNHTWLCRRSLDGDTLQLQNGGCPCDLAQSYSSSGESFGNWNPDSDYSDIRYKTMHWNEKLYIVIPHNFQFEHTREGLTLDIFSQEIAVGSISSSAFNNGYKIVNKQSILLRDIACMLSRCHYLYLRACVLPKAALFVLLIRVTPSQLLLLMH